MKIKSAEMIISAVSGVQYPGDFKPEFLLSGRSNVGKSSFINTLLNRKNLAYTSSKPGKTQTLNFFLINEKFYFVDVPGYGYARVSKKQREKFGKIIEEYISTRENLQFVFLLVDFRHKPSEDDVLMYNFLKYYQIPVVLIMTKADKVSKNQRQKHIKLIKETLDFDENDSLIAFSSVNSEGKDKVWKKISECL